MSTTPETDAPRVAITEELKRRLDESDAKGLSEYGATVDRSDFTAEQWTEHAISELLDAAKYLLARQTALERLTADVDEYHTLTTRQADLLSAAAIAVRGPEPELTKWSHHDIAERIKRELEMAKTERELHNLHQQDWLNRLNTAVAERDQAKAELVRLKANIGAHGR
jgi:hypothetical protein